MGKPRSASAGDGFETGVGCDTFQQVQFAYWKFPGSFIPTKSCCLMVMILKGSDEQCQKGPLVVSGIKGMKNCPVIRIKIIKTNQDSMGSI